MAHIWFAERAPCSTTMTDSSIVGTTKKEIPNATRSGAIILLGMIARATPSLLEDNLPLMVKIGLGEQGHVSLFLRTSKQAIAANLVAYRQI